MIDCEELLAELEKIKVAAKLPPIVDFGKYTMVVPFVELRHIVRELERKNNGKYQQDNAEA